VREARASYFPTVTVGTGVARTRGAIQLTNETTAVNILGCRVTAGVLLIKALGGGWNVSALPLAQEVTAR
jgi:outer membrane protein TolC